MSIVGDMLFLVSKNKRFKKLIKYTEYSILVLITQLSETRLQ